MHMHARTHNTLAMELNISGFHYQVSRTENTSGQLVPQFLSPQNGAICAHLVGLESCR